MKLLIKTFVFTKCIKWGSMTDEDPDIISRQEADFDYVIPEGDINYEKE